MVQLDTLQFWMENMVVENVTEHTLWLHRIWSLQARAVLWTRDAVLGAFLKS